MAFAAALAESPVAAPVDAREAAFAGTVAAPIAVLNVIATAT
jgi:hypothetical protein